MLKDPAHIDELFAAALAEPAASRASFLDRVCAENAELRERLDALLAAHDASSSFLELPADSTIPLVVLSERPGSTIGRYKLLEQIGEGGFGVVFMAEQERPVRRHVALKVIKVGMDTKQVVARFEAERQALAMMDHFNIAKVFDAGSTDTGRPYFVMELVRGVPITTYCDEARFTTNERLALFQSVCSAIQHAHQKGIIHRDLKPSNVLVTIHDDKAVSKVIDFGVAKATQARLTERTLFTEFRQMIGTPSYMSPEQAQMSGLDVDTRSDVYSLGVLLYELLTGTTPIDAKQAGSSSYDDLRRLICEVEPPSPSERLSGLSAERLTALADQRRCDPIQLPIRLRSDLDWIVMKCLDKDRNRRYETASALSQDLQRYLNGEPIEARPPTRRYRLEKFIRRNKVGVVAGTAIIAALIAGLAVASLGLVQARRQAAVAKVEYTRSAEVSGFLQKMLSYAAPSVAQGRDTTLLREVLDKTAERVATDLQGQEEVQGDLCTMLGYTYCDVGELPKAIKMCQSAVSHYQAAFPGDHKKVAMVLGRLGKTQTIARQADAGRANAQEGLAMARRIGDDSTLIFCLGTMASAQGQVGGYVSYNAESAPLYREIVAIRRKTSEEPLLLAESLLNLATQLIEGSGIQNKRECEESIREALTIYEAECPPDERGIAQCRMALAKATKTLDAWRAAEPAFRQSMDKARSVYPPGHTSIRGPMQSWIRCMVGQERPDEAAQYMRQCASESPDISLYWSFLGNIEVSRGNWTAALEAFQQQLKVTSNSPSPWYRIAILLQMTGHKEEARQHCSRFMDKAESAGELYFFFADTAAKSALLLPVEGTDLERAYRLSDDSRAKAAEKEAREHRILSPWSNLLGALTKYRQNKFDEAIKLAEIDSKPIFAFELCQATTAYLDAAALAQTKRREEALQALKRGDHLVATRTNLDFPYDDSWPDLVVANQLRGEAVALLGIESPPSKTAP